MKDNFFVDSNILLYLLSNDERKKNIANTILKSHPVISTQVLSENINVLLKKFKMLDIDQISKHLQVLLNFCDVTPISVPVIEKAIELETKYHYQWYDCTILSAALLNGCTVIYSEDMHHGQQIENELKIINPFI